MVERPEKALVERWLSAKALVCENPPAMEDFKPFEVIKMADPLRYQNLKWIARWNGSLCLLVCAFSILAIFVELLEGSLAIGEFLFYEIFMGVMMFYVLRLWRWGWRKD